MADRIGRGRDRVAFGSDERVTPVDIVRNRSECLVQLLGAFRDIADFDDIHQAAERLETIQAWINRETRAAAANLAFADDIAEMEFRPTQVSA